MNFGFIGLGEHCSKRMLPAIAESNSSKCIAIASEHYTDKFYNEIPVYNSYQEILKQNAIDAIYIATTSNKHFELCINALNSGKHVLCEKPICFTFDQANELAKTSKRNNKFLAEGFMYKHHEQFKTFTNLLVDNSYGAILSIRGSYKYNLSDTTNSRMNVDNGGGAFNDCYCYLINFVQSLINSSLNNSKTKITQNNETLILKVESELKFQNSTKAYLTASMIDKRENKILIECEYALIEICNAFHLPRKMKPLIKIHQSGKINIIEIPKDNHFLNQFNWFAENHKNTEIHSRSLTEIIANAKLKDVILETATFESLN